LAAGEGDLPDGRRQEGGKVGFRLLADASGSAGNVVANPLHRLADSEKNGGILQLFFICNEKSKHGPALSLPLGLFVSSSTKKDGPGQGSR